MATAKQRLDDLKDALVMKLNELNTAKEAKANKKKDLVSSSADDYPSVPAVKAALANKVDKVTGKALSDENYTAAEKQKLANLEGSKYRGTFQSEAQLPSSGNGEGSYADVDGGAGQQTVRYIWDNNDSQWVAQVGESTQLTASQVKQLYESNPDTNAFTDADEANLDENTTHRGKTDNPHGVTKAQVGLGNADNTADMSKPVSTAQAAAIAVVQNDLNNYRTTVVGEGPFPDYAQQLIDGLNF